MSLARHVVRRETVYCWRRRIPCHLVKAFDRPHVFISMRTRDPVRARSLAAQLNAVFEELMMAPETQFLSKGQLDGILRSVVATHLVKLDRVAAAGKSMPFFDASEAARMDVCVAWAYRLFDAQGADARVRDEDRDAMRNAGLGEKDIAFVDKHLDWLREKGLVPTRRSRLEELVGAQGAAATAMNIASAQQVYFRGLSLALFATSRRYGGEVPNAEEIVADILRADHGNVAAVAPLMAAVITSSGSLSPAVDYRAQFGRRRHCDARRRAHRRARARRKLGP